MHPRKPPRVSAALRRVALVRRGPGHTGARARVGSRAPSPSRRAVERRPRTPGVVRGALALRASRVERVRFGPRRRSGRWAYPARDRDFGPSPAIGRTSHGVSFGSL